LESKKIKKYKNMRRILEWTEFEDAEELSDDFTEREFELVKEYGFKKQTSKKCVMDEGMIKITITKIIVPEKGIQFLVEVKGAVPGSASVELYTKTSNNLYNSMETLNSDMDGIIRQMMRILGG
jgi:hypothetical protein